MIYHGARYSCSSPSTKGLHASVGCFAADRDRSRTMPSRIETRSVAGSYAGPRSVQSGGRYFTERPRSVNSNFESGRVHGLGSASVSVDQSGYVSDKADLGYGNHGYTRRASGSTGMANRCDRLRVTPQQIRSAVCQTTDSFFIHFMLASS